MLSASSELGKLFTEEPKWTLAFDNLAEDNILTSVSWVPSQPTSSTTTTFLPGKLRFNDGVFIAEAKGKNAAVWTCRTGESGIFSRFFAHMPLRSATGVAIFRGETMHLFSWSLRCASTLCLVLYAAVLTLNVSRFLPRIAICPFPLFMQLISFILLFKQA